MKIIVLMFLSLICIIPPSFAQEKVVPVNGTKFQPDKSKPSVYITFEKIGGKKPMVKSNEDNSERISMRLRNNTPFPIAVDANYDVRELKDFPITLSDGGAGDALPDSAEVEICYEAEAMPQMTAGEFEKIKVPKQVPSYYSCKWTAQRRGRGDVWIPSGSSILFSIPRGFLAENLKIYTLFNYEWESDKGQMNADEPFHQVYFYSTDLPYSLRHKL